MPLEMRDLQPVSLPDMARLGRWDDGGYVVPLRAIDEADTLVSFGVNDDVSFEAAVKDRRPDIRIECFDPSVDLTTLSLRAAKLAAKGLTLGARGRWAPAARELRYPRRVAEFASFFRRPGVAFNKKRLWYAGDASSVSIDEIFSSRPAANGRVFVKMDIEGSEYRFLRQLEPYLDRICGLAVEFHDVDIHQDQLCAILELLKRTCYVAHVHGNNITGYVHGTKVPMTLEVSFVSKALCASAPPLSEHDYPRQGLDCANHGALPDLALCFAGP